MGQAAAGQCAAFWNTACAGDVQLALLHVVALPTIDVNESIK